jgi:hypothetical protein
MKEDLITAIQVLSISIGSYLLGCEFGWFIGWGIWFVAMAI